MRSSRPVRAWQRYADARGSLLAAGIAYFGFLSLFPALALAVVVFGFVLAGRPDLLDAVAKSLNQMLPGLVRTTANPNGIIELTPPETLTLSVTGIVALVALVWGGLGWIASMRNGIRIVFGAPRLPGRFVYDKLRDLAVFVLLGVSVLVSASLTLIVGDIATWVSGWLGWGDQSWPVTAVSLLVSLIVNSALMLLLVRVLSGLPVRVRAIRSGVLLGGLGLTALELFGSSLIRWATRSPLFGSIVIVVGLLFWLNFIGRLVLFAGAWSACALGTAPSPSRLLEGVPNAGARPDRAGSPAHSEPGATGAPGADDGIDPSDARQRAIHGVPTLTRSEQDRVTLAAGAVLGATAAMTVGALGRVLRLLTPRRRSPRRRS
jgi:membrane protein